MKLSGWGRFPQHDCPLSTPDSPEETKSLLQRDGTTIARGNGRAYGDSALNTHQTLDMTQCNRLLEFDEDSGVLTVESGALLSDVIDTFLPRGWFPPVTPGTKFVTIGGMIAADVHGKNHHKHGSFGNFVQWLEVLDKDGQVHHCSPTENAELFEWTVGGMGLTGIILRAAFTMQPVATGWITQRKVRTHNLREAMDAFEDAQDSTYSVAWIDCLSSGASLGRSLLLLGEHAEVDDLPAKKRAQPFATPRERSLSVPFNFPAIALNKLTMRIFNAVYFRTGGGGLGGVEGQLVDWNRYFYPLDALLHWNRIYGRRGLAQFQCVLPLEQSYAGLTELLQATSNAGQGAFLAVLKRFGAQRGGFSFPMPGYTLALDFPVNRKTLALLETLDAITLKHGGRFYLAKDSRMSAQTFHQSDERMAAFRAFRHKTQSDLQFSSIQSDRLDI